MSEIRKGRPFYVCLIMLKHTCCLPVGNEIRFGCNAKLLVLILIHIFSQIFVTMHLLMAIRNKSGFGLSEDISVITTMLIFEVSVCLFLYNHKSYLKLCSDINNFREFGEPENFEEARKKGNSLAIIFVMYSTFCIFLYGFTTINSGSCKKFNEAHGAHEICNTFYPVWLPYDTISTSSATIISTLQLFATLTVFYSGICIGSLVCNSASLIVSHIDKLKEMIHLLFEESDPVIKSRKLKQWIRYHNIILRMGSQLAHLNKVTQGHIGIIGIICLATVENHIMHDKMVVSLLQLMGYVLGGFGLCHYGQTLTDEISSIGEAVYASKWYPSQHKMYPLIVSYERGYQNTKEEGKESGRKNSSEDQDDNDELVDPSCSSETGKENELDKNEN
ncbi:hypothetical protein JTB14_030061 [Gonioctena quinquepunctata]|nr:hypothetical protein JTB14_030061 [Gonioctena quinquepunctata]